MVVVYIRVDNATGFLPLKNDKFLKNLGIEIDLSRVKNKNGNPTVDKAIQELEEELKRLLPNGETCSLSTLSTSVRNVNNRVRIYGLSAREIILKRDSHTNNELNFTDTDLSSFKYAKRLVNHKHSEYSKCNRSNPASEAAVNVGNIVHIKKDGSKHRVRDYYLVVEVDIPMATIQKFCGNQLRSKKYLVKFNEIYEAPCSFSPEHTASNDSEDEDDLEIRPDFSTNSSSRDTPPVRSSTRVKKKPDYLATNEIQRT